MFLCAALSYSTIYPNSRDLGTAHASLAFGQLRTSAGLRPNRILQCAASLAAGGYDRPCGPIESLFLLSPARILDGRARLYSSELSYSYCMGIYAKKKKQMGGKKYSKNADVN